MILLSAFLLACVDTRPPPEKSRFDQPEIGDAAPEPEPEPTPQTEPEPTVLKAGAPQPVAKIPQQQRNGWRKTGGRSNISRPEMPTPRITEDQCSDLTEGGPLMEGEDCITAEIHCEESLIGHTGGGLQRFDGRFYEKKQCWPGTIDHDKGHERIYKLVMPEGEWRAWATLYTPCADLDLAGIRHDHGGCPSITDNTGACEMTVNDYDTAERIELTSQTKFPGQTPVWYIIVEGKDGEEGAFELAVQCRPGVGGAVDP